MTRITSLGAVKFTWASHYLIIKVGKFTAENVSGRCERKQGGCRAKYWG